MGFTFQEAYTLPIWQRHWFVERLKKELKASSGDGGDAPQNRGAHANDPSTRAMMGRHNPNAPARLRRFT